MARATTTPKSKAPTAAQDPANPDAPLPDTAVADAETTLTTEATIVPGTKPEDALTPENTPAAEPAAVIPAAPVIDGQSAAPMQADASSILRDTAQTEAHARSATPAVEAVVGTMLPDLLVDEDEPRLVVTCSVEGGRRRAGRRWPQGDTTIPAAALTVHDLAQLKGDPRFSVRPLVRD